MFFFQVSSVVMGLTIFLDLQLNVLVNFVLVGSGIHNIFKGWTWCVYLITPRFWIDLARKCLNKDSDVLEGGIQANLDLLMKLSSRLNGISNVLAVLELSFAGSLSAELQDLHWLSENTLKAKQVKFLWINKSSLMEEAVVELFLGKYKKFFLLIFFFFSWAD